MPDIPAMTLFGRVREVACPTCKVEPNYACRTEEGTGITRNVPHIKRIRAFLSAHPDITVAGGQIKTRSDIKGIR